MDYCKNFQAQLVYDHFFSNNTYNRNDSNQITIKNNIRLLIHVVSFKVLIGLQCFLYKFEFCDETISFEVKYFRYKKQFSFTIESGINLTV